MPKISVIMPVYNTKESYLREAIESILSQTYTDFEFIIIDDGSTKENVKQVVLSYEDKRIKYFYKENSGVADSLNYGWDKSKGEYIARMDSDDVSLPERFTKQVLFLDTHSDISLVGSWIELNPTKIIYEKIPSPKLFDFLDGPQVAHPTVMFRKSDFDKYNLRYNPNYAAEDYELWSRAIRRLKFANLQETLLKYRLSEQQVTSSNIDKMTECTEKIQEEILNFLTDNQDYQKKMKDIIKPPVLNIRKTYKLFHFIPFLLVKEKNNAVRNYLFNIIPFIKITKK